MQRLIDSDNENKKIIIHIRYFSAIRLFHGHNSLVACLLSWMTSDQI